MKARTKYTVIYTRDDESGWWTAEAKEARGCITQGRTIEQARERMREALQAFFDLPKPYKGELLDEIELPLALRRLVEAAQAARHLAALKEKDAAVKSREAIRGLTKGRRAMSLRDAGELLGITRQRAQQLAADVD